MNMPAPPPLPPERKPAIAGLAAASAKLAAAPAASDAAPAASDAAPAASDAAPPPADTPIVDLAAAAFAARAVLREAHLEAQRIVCGDRLIRASTIEQQDRLDAIVTQMVDETRAQSLVAAVAKAINQGA